MKKFAGLIFVAAVLVGSILGIFLIKENTVEIALQVDGKQEYVKIKTPKSSSLIEGDTVNVYYQVDMFHHGWELVPFWEIGTHEIEYQGVVTKKGMF